MAVFAIIVQPSPNTANLARVVADHFAGANYQLAGGHGWLVSAAMTSKGLSDHLGITDGSNGAAVILEVASYFGRADPNVWTWIQQNWEGPVRA
jgi:hypothetical protein